MDYLEPLKDPHNEANFALIHHRLGRIAQERQKFDEAEEWYRKALEIFERLGLERGVADEYHQLGIIAEERQKFDEADEWYRKALEIFERQGLELDAADDYHQLGTIAQERQKFDEADEWYRKALEIYDQIGHPPLKVKLLGQMGILKRMQNQFKDAIVLFATALGIAVEYEMQIGQQILLDLAYTMNLMGDHEFRASWQQALNEEPSPELMKTLVEISKDIGDNKDDEHAD